MRLLYLFAFGLVPFFLAASAHGEELSVGFLNQTFGIGHGFNPVTGEFYRPCIKVPATERDVSGTATESYEIKRITSSSEIRDTLNLNAYGSMFGGTYKVSSTIDKLMTNGLRSSSTYFSVRVRVTGDNKTITQDIQISDSGLAGLKKSEEFFRAYCGDSFVSATRGGGELFALISLENISENQAKSFEASLNASYLGSADVRAKYSDEWQKLREESRLNIEIMQSGVIDEPFKSLTDIDLMLDYARQFPDRIRKSGKSNIQSIIYQKYSNSISFGLTLDDANLERFHDFDESNQAMREIIRAYDLANTRFQLATDALSRPDEFEEVNSQEVSNFLDTISTIRSRLAALARNCASAAKGGKSCSLPAGADLVVPTMANLKRSAPCNTATFQVSNGSSALSCSQVKKVKGTCQCVECRLFSSPPYSVQDEQGISDRCFKMPTGLPVSVSITANVQVSPNAADHWLIVNMNGINLITKGNLQGYQTPIMTQLDDKVGADGSYTATLQMSKCQSNVAQRDTCTLNKIDGRGTELMVVRVKD